MYFKNTKSILILLLATIYPVISQAICSSDNADNFNEWISVTREQALNKGISSKVVNEVFSSIQYRNETIIADRKQFTEPTLTFEEYLQNISYLEIIANGKIMQKKYDKFLLNIQRKYGVPAGVLMALWGLESKFGEKLGNVPIFSTLATLAYDCRRSKLFTREFYAALSLMEKGIISTKSLGATHGEIGQFQFLPSNVDKFAVDADKDGRADLINSKVDAIESTAKFLKGNGWIRGKGYQPKEENFEKLKIWNNSKNYIKVVAYIASQIDGLKIKNVYD
ncbi:lytic murein transglycosylase [Candidatus Liberibacter brunswickensis]|uniref:lytic murein transglycosylase n=1 Tax=Candidatus Liberibacter brunswickensis TaxID=1968796 RepID=UPI002FE24E6F